MTADFGGLRMKHLKRCIALICALCMVLGLLSGCGKRVAADVYKAPGEFVNVPSGVVAENSRYSMSWNADRAAVLITDKATGAVWGTTPAAYLDKTNRDDFMAQESINSSLAVRCRKDASSGEQEMDYYAATGAIQQNTYTSEKIENGISVTYYFDQIQVIVTQDFYLEDDAFKVKVDPAKIKSCGAEQVVSVTPAPFLCSVANTAAGSKDAYLVVPSGSGALMYADQRSDGLARSFEAPVYGSDKTIDKYVQDENETAVTMPFYGVKVGANALCAIVEQSAEGTTLSASAGVSGYGYSNVALRYNVTGYNEVYNTNNYRTQYINHTEKEIAPLVIGYRALSAADSSYTGIAKCYRNYLLEKNLMGKSQDNTLLNVRLVGAVIEDDLFLGLPKTNAVALTSYDEAQTILGELSTIAGGNLSAQMYGYGAGGINSSKLAGNYKLTGAQGNSKKLKSFVEYVNSNSVKTYFNFDTVLYASSTAGFSASRDCAINANGAQAAVRQFNVSTRDRMTKSQGGRINVMIARSQLGEATLKTVDVADKYGITGLSYNTLGSMAYSDYQEDGYAPLCDNMGKDVAEIINKVKTNSKTVMVDGALSYAAAAADVLTNCPTASAEHFCFDQDVPLYQIVFQGTKANSVSPINGAVNPRKQFLKAIETGSGLSFNLIANYNTELRKQNEKGLQSALYSDNKAKIEAFVKESEGYLAKVAGAKIADHQQLTETVAKTVFENGVTVYVNFGSADYQGEAGTVQAQSFMVK